MLQIFKREMKANLKSMLIWSIVVMCVAGMAYYEYSIILKSGSDMGAMFDMMPRIVKVLYGAGELSIGTLKGYYACCYLWIALIVFVHAALLGANIVSKEERDKTTEFLFTKPIKRNTVLTGKIIACIVNVTIIAIVVGGTTAAVLLPQVKGESFLKEVVTTTFRNVYYTDNIPIYRILSGLHLLKTIRILQNLQQ